MPCVNGQYRFDSGSMSAVLGLQTGFNRSTAYINGLCDSSISITNLALGQINCAVDQSCNLFRVTNIHTSITKDNFPWYLKAKSTGGGYTSAPEG